MSTKTNTQDSEDQERLNGMVLANRPWPLQKVTGAASVDEMDRAIRRADVRPTTDTLIPAARVAALGYDVPNGVAYLSEATARAVLSPDFWPVEIDGVTFSPPKAVPRDEVTFYTGADVDAIRAALVELRTEDAERRLAEKAERSARRTAWINGEEGVFLTYEDLRLGEDVRDSHRSTVERAVVGGPAQLAAGASNPRPDGADAGGFDTGV